MKLAIVLPMLLTTYVAFLAFDWSRELQDRITVLERQVSVMQQQCPAEARSVIMAMEEGTDRVVH